MLYFKKENTVYKVKEDEIKYVQQSKRNIMFVTDKGEFCLRGQKIGKIAEALGDNFCMCHSYIIVNLSQVDLVGSVEVVLDGEVKIGMGKTATNKLKKALMERSILKI